jgi:hypothetical protein
MLVRNIGSDAAAVQTTFIKAIDMRVQFAIACVAWSGLTATSGDGVDGQVTVP